MLTGDAPAVCLLIYDMAHRLAMSLCIWWHLACMKTGMLCAYSKIVSVLSVGERHDLCIACLVIYNP
jgi:hypothetical protein